MAGIALPVGAAVAGRVAAQLGLGLAAGKIIDTGINRTIPYALNKAKEITSKYKLTHGLSNAIGKVEGVYNSKGGKIAREAASIGGSILAFGGAGKVIGRAPVIGKAIARGAGQVGQGLRTVTKGTRVGRVLEDQFFNPKKGAYITKAAKKFNQAKVNLSEKATKVKGTISKGAEKIGRKFGRAKQTITKPFRAPTNFEKAMTKQEQVQKEFEAWNQSGKSMKGKRQHELPPSQRLI